MYSRDNEKKICAPNDTDMRRVSVIRKREGHADPKICSMNINNIVFTSRCLKKYSSSVHNGKFQPLIVIVTRSTILDVNQILLMLACQKIRKRSVNFFLLFFFLTKYLDGTNQIFLIGRKSKNKAVKKGNFVCKLLSFLSKEFFNELQLYVLSKL